MLSYGYEEDLQLIAPQVRFMMMARGPPLEGVQCQRSQPCTPFPPWIMTDCRSLPPPQVPRSCQCMLMSATVSDEVERLNKLILHSPVTLNLLEAGGLDGKLGAGSGELGTEGAKGEVLT